MTILKLKSSPASPSEVSASSPRPSSPQLSPQALKRHQAQTRLTQIKAVQQAFMHQWPALFDLQQPKPLKIGIIADMYPIVAPPFSKTQVRIALQAYTQRRAYLLALLQQEWRYDLQGQTTEQITSAHKEHAGQQLDLQQQRFERRQQQAQQRRPQLSPEAVHKVGGKGTDNSEHVA